MKNLKMNSILTYQSELPSARELELPGVLHPFTEVSESQYSSWGFVEHPTTHRTVSEFPGGYALCFRSDEKVIPAAVVNSVLAKRVATLQAEHGDTIDRDGRLALKEQVIQELLKTTPVRTELIYAYYHIGSQQVYVATASPAKASRVMSGLVKSLGSLKTQTLHFDGVALGLSTRLVTWLNDGDVPFGPFDVGIHCRLERATEGNGKEVVNYSNVHLDECPGLEENIASGYSVTLLDLYYNGLSFKIDRNFQMKSIIWPETPECPEDDEVAVWTHEAGARIFILNSAVSRLTRLFTPEDEDLL